MLKNETHFVTFQLSILVSQWTFSRLSHIYLHISTCVCHHHHNVPRARISLTLSRNFSQSFIASGRSSGLHPVSSLSCCMYVRAGRPAFARPYAGIHRSTLLMSSFLLHRQCPACLVCLNWIIFWWEVGGRWYLVGFCRQDLFNIARNILEQLPSSFFSSRLCIVVSKR